MSAYDTDEELAKHLDFSVIDLLTQDVSAYDSDEELAKHVDISILDLLKLTQIKTRRWKQLARWRAGANYYIRQALVNSRRHWAHMACKMMSERNDRCKKFIRLRNQQNRLANIKAFGKLFLRVLTSHYRKLPMRTQALIMSFKIRG